MVTILYNIITIDISRYSASFNIQIPVYPLFQKNSLMKRIFTDAVCWHTRILVALKTDAVMCIRL